MECVGPFTGSPDDAQYFGASRFRRVIGFKNKGG